MTRWPPSRAWLADYNGPTLGADLLAGLVVTIMLVPQSLAYALLAGLPPEMGLYATILPLAAYALLGTSRTLSVGPVAVIALMTASAVERATANTGIDAISAAIALAALSGGMLLLMGLARFGFLANFLSHPVISGFITASGLLIALGQVRHLLGVPATGDTLPALLATLSQSLPDIHLVTVANGVAVLLFLLWSRQGLGRLLRRLGVGDTATAILSRSGPVLAIAASVAASQLFDFSGRGVELLGPVPSGLPTLALPALDLPLWRELLVPALLIAVIGFVESISVGKTLAAKRRQRIDADHELVALGGANIASAVAGGFPVSGGFSRSVVNFDAGAQTQAASIIAALGIALAAVSLTPLLVLLPKATLAATIIVAVISLVDLGLVRRAWRYARADFAAVAITIVATLLLGVEIGVLSGMLASVLLHLYKSSRPHVAVVGAVAGTEHYRNVDRHLVVTYPTVVSLRIDESLFFANAGFLEDYIYRLVAERPDLQHLILQCTAINEIDLSALEMLESVDQRLKEQGITLNLSEVKGPVMDALGRVEFLQHLSGRVFLSQHQAVQALKPDEIEPYIP